jgi:hypothetical protein
MRTNIDTAVVEDTKPMRKIICLLDLFSRMGARKRKRMSWKTP